MSQLEFLPDGSKALRAYQNSIALEPRVDKSKVSNRPGYPRNWRNVQKREGIKDNLLRRMYKAEALDKQNGKCLYCTAPMSIREATAEHKVPVSRGGLTEKSNIDAACETCNKIKNRFLKPDFNRAIHEPNLLRDGWDLHFAGIEIRMRRRAELACRRIRAMVGQK